MLYGNDWDLTVKTQGMASCDDLSAAHIASLQTDSGEIEMVNNFTYLGSVVCIFRWWELRRYLV